MRHAEARAEIETRFAAVWTATPVAFENVAFEPPADGSAWVRLTVVNGGGLGACALPGGAGALGPACRHLPDDGRGPVPP
jgi:hypothetical protein